MPVSPRFRVSYLQQRNYSNSTQLLEWLQTAKETITENETNISQLLADKQNLLNELTELQRNNGGESKNGEILKLIHRLEKKESQNEELEKINEFLQSELEQVKQELDQQLKAEKKKNNQVKTHRRTLTELEITLESKDDEITNLRNRLQELVVKQRDCRSNQQKLENELGNVLSAEELKNKEVTKYRAQIEYLKEKSQKLETEQIKLLQEFQKLSENYNKAEKIIEEKEQKLSEIQGKLNTREEELDELVERLNNTELNNTSEIKDEIKTGKENYQDIIKNYENLLAKANEDLDKEKKEKERLEQEKIDQQNNTESNSWTNTLFSGSLGNISIWSVIIGGVIYGGYLIIKNKLDF